ncbi:hypothetical protein K504DRAFT_117101 [Pleomassaria siparia CBS 279.74]|uniref:Uncharacterized protein n=1 Tax=Pleomassaria siparia CBS 279.74 TaxID=1314801 RepID=A0A6G1JW48_9PLEO|nr:hypothetical protein K504DRAFT_117101 [Pleomassaria siparia CBS 279.74]
MGNCCGSQSEDNFQGQGRTLGAPPPQTNNAKASIPSRIANPNETEGPSPRSKAKLPKITGPGRTLGSGGGSDSDARAAAAAAAEVRNFEVAPAIAFIPGSRVAPQRPRPRSERDMV